MKTNIEKICNKASNPIVRHVGKACICAMFLTVGYFAGQKAANDRTANALEKCFAVDPDLNGYLTDLLYEVGELKYKK